MTWLFSNYLVVQRKTTAAACVVIQYVTVWGVALLPETT